MAALAGIALASIAYFYGNRLLPLSLADRSAGNPDLPRRLGSHAGARILASTAPCLDRAAGDDGPAVPGPAALNWATTGQHLWRYAVNGQHLQAAVEITALAFGLLLLYMACALRRHWSDASDAASTRQAGKPRPDNKGAAHRWQIASRVLAASAGGYLVSAVAMSALALAFPALAGAQRPAC